MNLKVFFSIPLEIGNALHFRSDIYFCKNFNHKISNGIHSKTITRWRILIKKISDIIGF